VNGRTLSGRRSSLMKPVSFRYFAPHTVDDALDYVREEGGELRSRAPARHTRFEAPVSGGALSAFLPRAARQIGHLPIRSRGTFCGSIAHADPGSRSKLAADFGFWLGIILFCALMLVAQRADTQTLLPPAPSTNPPTKIVGLFARDGTKAARDNLLSLGLGDELLVLLDGTDPLDASKWILYLDGRKLTGLSATTFVTQQSRGLAFRLLRTDKNHDAWAALLSPPTRSRKVLVSVTSTDADGGPRLVGAEADGTDAIQLKILGTPWLLFAVVIAAAVLFLLGWGAVHTPLLRDKLLPQIPQRQRPFSLGSCQMAFWFTLVVVSFLFLWALLWDYNTVTQSALMLMGISTATGLGALAANTTNNDAVQKADKDLRDLGFKSPEDIEILSNKLKNKRAEAEDLKAAKRSTDALDLEIRDLELQRSHFYEIAKDYVSATYDPAIDKYDHINFFNDLITDKDGPALHRVQAVGWTSILGVVFLAGVYHELSMPDFNAALLALMALSGGTYIGFKFPEKT
jgi:hypothetical protein